MKILKDKRFITIVGTIVIVLLVMIGVTGCGNKEIWDRTYTYNKAICNVGGEWREFEISKWTDYDGEQIQIWDKQGNYYLMSSVNCTLIKGE